MCLVSPVVANFPPRGRNREQTLSVLFFPFRELRQKAARLETGFICPWSGETIFCGAIPDFLI